MTIYPQDSTATAVILQDIGTITLTDLGPKWGVVHTHSRRIKVLDESAFDQGNLRIYYLSNREQEKFKDLDVQLITPAGEKVKVKSDQVFTEKVNERVSAKKIFIPNLQKGCIIEYRYEIQSESIFTLYDWYFQDELPVRWSDLTVTIPVYFDYVYLLQASHAFESQEGSTQEETGVSGLRYMAYRTHYGLANLPAIKEEPYITTLDDYRAHIGFQLSATHFPQQADEKILTSWADLAGKLEEDKEFGQQYMKSNHFKRLWELFSIQLIPGESPEKLAERALRFVSSQIKWNGNYRKYTDGDLDDVFQQKTGSSADLNLALVALLRKAGLDAVPLLVSTRTNGATYPEYPFVQQFNSVVALLRKDSSSILLDATDPFHAVDEVRTQHYNGRGWTVDQKKPIWVDVIPTELSITWLGDLRLAEDGAMTGQFTMRSSGPLASDQRSELQHTTPPEFVKKNFATSFTDITFDSVSIVDQENYSKPLQMIFRCQIPNLANLVNDFLYCGPILDFIVQENPFKTLKRNYPVDFPYPMRAQYVVNVALPAGYAIEELPAPARVVLPNNGGKISFTCGKNADGGVQVVLRMNLTQLHFEPGEYDGLRKFFQRIAEKTETQLVLRKT